MTFINNEHKDTVEVRDKSNGDLLGWSERFANQDPIIDIIIPNYNMSIGFHPWYSGDDELMTVDVAQFEEVKMNWYGKAIIHYKTSKESWDKLIKGTK
jgi:hypothetical protein